MSSKLKIIVSGGGTGGHIFPAISIADAIKSLNPNVKILFVGATGRMEMERVPAAGYQIVGLPVAGFQRRLTFKNITFFFKLAASILKARKIIRSFKPDAVAGVGGYASGPVMRAAAAKQIPTLIQEQNSYPGVTNRLLAKKAVKICTAYPDMERFFPPEKIILTGNPVRRAILNKADRNEACREFGLQPDRQTILIIGGSLGAGSINKAVQSKLNMLKDGNVQVIWQTGKHYYPEMSASAARYNLANLKVMPFIQRMDLAYAVADVVISRAGAGTISELALLGKAAVLVPSPNVSEDHQTKNAMALVNKKAAVLVRDADAHEHLLAEVEKLVCNTSLIAELQTNIHEFAKPDADTLIAHHVLELAEKHSLIKNSK
ncbi:MAG: undecaprenyldiphospho-muramoylpentapeptide beta-N-acetylglucosaminyltransferase [Bacteroidales bacterium]|jgi:UDP-N-acetylglucosamine--N-acetylmuramyl-(pentapeptide) pyrophosphoryl-undecaprenol N-acetylglucosamine transferase|nr:undecaprenyldiphospho-muramoylpentapeptide beta-N-acetylglucosaminyltransferase [Bacteroidales bacterium]